MAYKPGMCVLQTTDYTVHSSAVVLKLFGESIILIQMKMQSIEKIEFQNILKKKIQKIC